MTERKAKATTKGKDRSRGGEKGKSNDKGNDWLAWVVSHP